MTDSRTHIPNVEILNLCPCCDSTHFRSTGTAGIARCRQCGALFQNPRPLLSEIINSYNTGTTYAAWTEDHERRQRGVQRRLNYFKALCRGRALLDIGCGDGRFMSAAAEAGFDVSGTEVSQTAAHLAKASGLPVHTGELSELHFSNVSFDVITLWHVLEHVSSPNHTLSLCFDLLRPGGILALATPNALHYLHRLYLPGHNHAFTTRHTIGSEIHITHFTPACLRSLIRRHGFSILRFGVDRIHRDSGLIRTIKNTVLDIQATFGLHFGCAMYFVARKPDIR